MIAIAAVAICTPQQAGAFTVTATITGKVTGNDTTAVFGTKGAIKGAFKATFTFNSTQGTAYGLSVCNYNGRTNSPVIQVTLEINNHPYTFNPNIAPNVSISSLVSSQYATSPKLALNFSFNERFGDSKTEHGSDGISIALGLYGNTINMCRWWYDPFYYLLQPGDTTQGYGFNISNYSPDNEAVDVASGTFTATQVTVTQSP